MSDIYETTAEFTDEKTLVLDEALPITGGRVRITLEPLANAEAADSRDFLKRLQTIHQTLFDSGFIPPTRESVDQALNHARNQWDE